ncbi:MAG: hypothetical protein IKL57_08400 [Oscillospiraceae bacterium]|nr:hypothetical protein [Oscillospiraceae bacterium]
MKTPKIAKALGFIGDDLITEAMDYRPKKKAPFKKMLALAACFCFISILVLALPYISGASAEDPDWPKTHFETESYEEIAAKCGEDLLIDKLAVKEDFHSEYILEIRKGGSFENPADFIGLSATVNYGKSIFDSEGEQFFCFISFNGKADGVFIDEYLRSGEFETKEMTVDGYSVKYAEMEPLNKINANRIIAEFEYGGYKYYVSSESPNPEFFGDMMENMLG